MAEAPFIRSTWPRCAAIEIDRFQFVALWMAWDRANDVAFLYGELVSQFSAFPIHADAVRKRGSWIPAIFDPESRGRKKEDGIAIARQLGELSVDIHIVPMNEEVGVLTITDRLTTGRLRVDDTLRRWETEYQTFRRDEKGELPESGALLMRATSLLVQYGLTAGITENKAASDAEGFEDSRGWADNTRSSVTGY